MKKTLTIILSLLVFAAVSFSAEVYIKQQTHTDAIEMMGQSQPAKDEVNHMWLADNKMATHGTDQSVIINLDKSKMYMINHQTKTYVEMDLPLDISKYFPPQFAQMMSSITIKVTPTGETQKIGNWNCSGYDVDSTIMMMNQKQKIWASTDVPFDWNMYAEKMLPKLMQGTMMLSEESVKEFMKIKGFQIRTESTMNVMGNEMKSYSEVIEITKKNAPAGTFDPPSDYEKKDQFSMEDMQKR
ncbi:MAG: DUF4412 domain-containing protein [Candidatus Aminicenantes bacterium]|nr:DUF4412 domain-containing protein [Candidatus Aminicenantes bacterium]HHF51398.1 DUF4412 domain-containing protein [Candidatus Aminicenantes bacterium]